LPAVAGPGIARRATARIARERIGAALLARHAVMTRTFESKSPSPLNEAPAMASGTPARGEPWLEAGCER
jgi:hypothetical protein